MPNPDQTTKLETELAIRRKQIGLLANCLSHIENSSIAPEGIKIAATAALAGARELTLQIKILADPDDGPSAGPELS